MSGLEIILIVAGIIMIIVSFLFFSKSDSTTVQASAELTNKQKEDMRNQILSIFDEQIEAIQEKTEITLEKMSTQKMMEMNDYSETILGEINRNHNEVMFLYEMLNEKKKEVTNTVKEISQKKKELETLTKETVLSEPEDIGFMAGEAVIKAEKKVTRARTKKESVLDQLDAVSGVVADDTQADEDVATEAPKTRKRTSPAKTAATRARTTVKKETEREENKDITVFETGNNNEKILSLSAQGKSNIEIAKELGLGIGEVKLVIDLFRGGK